MDSTARTPKTYLAHRENQRERILAVAEKLFIQEGIEKINLSAIARAAHMTRNTLYEYFPNKQEIAWAILQKIFQQARSGPPAAARGNGLQQIEQLMAGMRSQLERNPDHARFIVEFNSLYAREVSSERMRQLTGRSQGEDVLARLILEGMADGSLRPGLDPALVSSAIWNLLSGMNARFGLLGGQIEQEYEQPASAIYQEICRIFLSGIRSSSETKEKTA